MTRHLLALLAFILLAIAVLVPRVRGLGTTLTNDEPLWQGRAHQFILGIATLQPQMTFGGGQPGVTTMWVAGLADRFATLRASQLSIAIATSGLVLLIAVLLTRACGMTMGILGGFFLAFDNFLIGHSRVVHTDAFLALGVLITLILLALVWKTGSPRYLVLAGMSTSFAILSKLMGGLLLLPALGTIFAVPLSISRQRRFWRFGAALLLTILLVWPALWTPWAPLRFMTERVILHSEETDVGKGGSDPFYYPREWFFRLSPVTTIAGGLGLFGAMIGTGQLLPRLRARRFWIWLTLSVTMSGTIMSFGGQRSDRYFLMGNVAADVLGAAGVVWTVAMFRRLLPHVHGGALTAVLAIPVVALLATDAWRIHPYYLAHYNRLLPVNLTHKLGWGEGLEQAALWLKNRANSRETPVVTYYSSVLGRWYEGDVWGIGHEYDTTRVGYVVLYRSMFGRELDSRETQYLQGYFRRGRCRHDIVINDLPYVWIFDRLPEAEAPTAGDTVRSHRDLLPLPVCETRETVAS